MKAIPVAAILFLLAASLFLAGCTTTTTAPDPEITNMKAVAGQLTASINTGLGDLRAGLSNTSRTLSTTGLSGRETEAVLTANLLHYPNALSSLVISRDGIIMASVPPNYNHVVGTNLSGQPEFQSANAGRAPIVSRVFMMVEGFRGISQSYPVFSPSGEYLGYTDITYRPEIFIGRSIEPVINGTDYDVWVVQTEGTEIYDTTPEEIGKNILTDPAYADPGLKEIAGRILKEPSGSGKYVFWDRDWNRNISKIAVWDTAGIDGAEWRVVVTKSAQKTNADTPVTTSAGGVTPDARYANLTGFVQKAAAYAKEHGREAALGEFNNPNGSFIDGDLYIFAYTMNGTVLALPYQKGLLGTDRRGITDANGVAFIDQLTGIAREGGGSLYYIYPNPDDNFREEFKYSYVQPVDNTWFVGSGIYLPERSARFNSTDRDVLVERVKQARTYAQMHGAGKAVSDFNDRNGVFANGSRYIFAYGYNGTTLAMPFQPEAIGSNRMNFTDTYGVKVAAWEIAAAQRGGGFVYVDYFNPDTGTPGMKLCYVAPVDDTWLVGSGIYTER